MKEILKYYYNRLRGFGTKNRYKQIFEEIREIKPSRIMEIGVYTGETALRMIKEMEKSADDSIYFGFDLFEDLTEELFKAEISKKPPSEAEVRDYLENNTTSTKIRLIKGNTHNTMPEVIDELPVMDFIFIDGGHSVESVVNDWKYSQKIMDEDTVVYFDDYWSGAHLEGGCNTIIDNLNEDEFEVDILPIQDKFEKEYGVLKINMVKVKRK